MASDEEITPSDERRIEIFKEKLGKILREIFKRSSQTEIIPKEKGTKQEKIQK